jgi:phage baseplate assembly protein W
MAQISPFPGTGIDMETGKLISGWQHVMQSLQIIFMTRFGERVLRRWFGSFVPRILGEPMVPSTILKFWTAICVAVDLWEPRYRITKITAEGSADEMRQGSIGFIVEGVYMPRGHLGDKTAARGQYTFRVGQSASSVGVRAV